MGEYLGVTAARMGPGDAIFAQFADYFIPEAAWDALKAELVKTGDWEAVDRAAVAPPESEMAAQAAEISRLFSGESLRDIMVDLAHSDSPVARAAEAMIAKNSPLAMACAVELVHRARLRDDIEHALKNEYRFTSRSMELGDFLEGIRAAIIDRDRKPVWKHDGPNAVPAVAVANMLRPLGVDELKL
jgi:enoyl-CoA hydratase